MFDHQTQLLIYLNLAKQFKSQLKIPDHDRTMVLAAVAACELGLHPVGQFCRKMVLNNNPGHMIGRFDTVNQALSDYDFQHFIRKIHRRYPTEHAEGQLDDEAIDVEAGLARAGSLDAYLSELLGVDVSWINEHFEI